MLDDILAVECEAVREAVGIGTWTMRHINPCIIPSQPVPSSHCTRDIRFAWHHTPANFCTRAQIPVPQYPQITLRCRPMLCQWHIPPTPILDRFIVRVWIHTGALHNARGMLYRDRSGCGYLCMRIPSNQPAQCGYTEVAALRPNLVGNRDKFFSQGGLS